MRIKVLPVITCLVMGIIVTSIVGYFWYSQVKELQQKRFDNSVLQLNDYLEDELALVQSDVKSLRGFFDASEYVSADEFAIYSKVLIGSSNIIRALEWAPKLRYSDVKTYEIKAQKAHSEFHIFPIPKNKQPPYIFPVYYIEPLLTNEGAFGFNLASNPMRYAAIIKSIDANSLVSSKSIELKQSPGNYATLVFLPIYSKNITEKSIESARGVVLAVVDLQKVVTLVINKSQDHSVGIKLFEIDQGKNNLIASSLHDIPKNKRISKNIQIGFGGRVWDVQYYSNKDYYADDVSWVGLLIIALGLLITIILAVYINQILMRVELTRSLVKERTKELDQLNQNLKIEVDISKEKEVRIQEYSDEIKLVYDMISIYAKDEPIEVSLLKSLKTICNATRWPIGHVYENINGMLKPTHLWVLDDRSKNKEFHNVTMKKDFVSGEGLPGMVLEGEGRAVWVLDVANSSNFPRAKICQDLKLHNAFAFGISVADEVKYILEFFSYNTLEENDRLTRICEVIRKQTGRLLDKKVIEQQLSESEEQNRLILQSAGEGIYGLDLEGNGTFINPAALEMLGYHSNELIGKGMHAIIHNKYADGSIYQKENCPMHKSLEEGTTEHSRGEVFWHKNGTCIPVEYLSTPMRKGEELVGVVVMFSDISNELKAEERLEHMATHDSLLDLPNRTYFELYLQNLIDEYKEKEQQFAILYLDLDNFKDVNDSLGHSIGDGLLKSITDSIRHCIGPNDLLARLGGDEFAILITSALKSHELRIYCSRIIEALKQVYIIEDNYISIGVSIGVAVFPAAGNTAELLTRNADIAMYRVKRKGKNNYKIFDDKLNRDYLRYLELKRSLKPGIEHREFQLLYQPVYDLESNQVVGAEALVRWNHTSLGMIFPDEFIDIAEDNGDIHVLGLWILERALLDLKNFHAQGFEFDVYTINVSPLQLVPKLFTKEIFEMLKLNQLTTNEIVIELTEKDLPGNLGAVEESLTKLQKAGIRIYIDDFGTGSSSLVRLKKIPFSGLKIDFSFVSQLPDDEESKAIIDVIMTLAERFKVDVIAEGVETKEQAEYLRSIGCPKAQGFYFSRPVTVNEFLKLDNKKRD
jgi:diguanylate cyclase (GGDEF)-like protein/PAS domain S-box-containing protein